MKLFIEACSWEEVVREGILHLIDNELSIIDFKVYADAIASAIARNDIDRATDILFTHSETGCTHKHAKSLIQSIREVWEANNHD